jgi:hypothetical protein
MKRFKEKLNELSNELLHRYKEKAADDARAADAKGDFKRGDKRFSGVVKATKKQFDNRKIPKMNEEVELDEAIPKSTHYATVHSSSKKIVAKGNKKDMLKKMKELNKKETGSHHLGMTHRGKVGDTFGEEVEQIDEISAQTKSSYIQKAKKEVKELKPHTKGEYGDIAKNLIKRREKGIAMAKEEIEQIEEKNAPTSPEKWAHAKSAAKSKFDVYPSAYANAWAAKKYKSMGGGWKSVKEEKEDDLPFTPDKPKKNPVAKAGKYGVGYSTAKHLAKMAMQKVKEKKLKETMMGKISN